MDILEKINEDAEGLIALRRDFHTHPEVSLHEQRTARRIEEELDSYGICEHHRCGETGVYAILRGEKPGNRVIVLRADTDALAIAETQETPYRSQNPGVMHACGHDAHTACLLGAARALAASRREFGGEIRFFFQHAEEVGAGAREFIREGLLDGAERVFGLHTASDLPVGSVGVTPGPNNAAVDHFKITIHGRAAHVSTPQKGVDALYIASAAVVALQAVSTRLTSPTEPVLIGVGKLQAGTAYNIVASLAELEGTLRTVTPETRKLVKRHVTEIAQQTAALYGGTAELVWTDYASPLLNPEDVCAEVAKQVLSAGARVISNRPLSLGGDDFAEFNQRVPGVYAYLGTGNPQKPNTVLPAHNDGFDIDEDALVIGARLYAVYALSWLEQEK